MKTNERTDMVKRLTGAPVCFELEPGDAVESYDHQSAYKCEYMGAGALRSLPAELRIGHWVHLGPYRNRYLYVGDGLVLGELPLDVEPEWAKEEKKLMVAVQTEAAAEKPC